MAGAERRKIEESARTKRRRMDLDRLRGACLVKNNATSAGRGGSRTAGKIAEVISENMISEILFPTRVEWLRQLAIISNRSAPHVHRRGRLRLGLNAEVIRRTDR